MYHKRDEIKKSTDLVSSKLVFLKVNALKWNEKIRAIITEKVFIENKIIHYMQLDSTKKEHSYFRIKFQNPVDFTNFPIVREFNDKLKMEFRV